MSHYQERKEKNCLNCNAEVAGRFCQVCGQENVEPKESFWVLATHFVHDLTHFDGKFFSTLKYLLFKPAFLSKEYLKGRRTSYLHPIRMYVFTSFVFFLIFFNFYQTEDALKVNNDKKPVTEVVKQFNDQKQILEKTISKIDSSDKGKDTAGKRIAREKTKLKVEKLNEEIKALTKDSTKNDSIVSGNSNLSILGVNYEDIRKIRSIEQYDSLQNTLPAAKKDGLVKSRIKHQLIHLKVEFKDDPRAFGKRISEKFLHMFPQLLFVSLPFFALILQLLYVRRKQLYYVSHVVFTLHLYCGTFILILASLLLGSLLKMLHVEMVTYSIIAYLFILFYWYKSFRNFYSQSRRKTIFKFMVLFFLTMIMMSFLFAFFFIFSAFLV